MRWHCPPDTGFEIRALVVWGRARYLSVTEAPHNTDFYTWMGKKHFCFFQTAETGNRTPNSSVKGSGANHYPRPPALDSEDPVHKFESAWPAVVLKLIIHSSVACDHTIVRFTLNSSTRIIEFRGSLSQFSTNFHKILHTLFSIHGVTTLKILRSFDKCVRS